MRHRGASPLKGPRLPSVRAARSTRRRASSSGLAPRSTAARSRARAWSRRVPGRVGPRAGGAGDRHVGSPPIRGLPRARGLSLTMWRAAKRAAAAALRDAGRGVAASSARPSAPSSSAAAERVAEAAARRHQQRRRSTNAEGLVQLRHIWELETAAAARRRARGDDAAATAMGMIRALRRAGCSWFDVAANPAVRREASNAVAAWESGGSVAAAAATAAAAVRRPVEVAARRAAAQLRRVVPTLALRHAGGSWADVLYHPAFRFRLEIARAAESDAKAMIAAAPRAPLAATRGLTRGARGRGTGEGVRDRPATPSGRVTRTRGRRWRRSSRRRRAPSRGMFVVRRGETRGVSRVRSRARRRGGILCLPRHVRATSVHDGAGDVGDEVRRV